MHKVVFHIDEAEKWSHTMGNIKNLLNYGNSEGEDYQVTVLVNGDGIMGYLMTTGRKAVKNLGKEFVRFHACKNAMKSHGIAAKDLPDNVEIVPAGVADLIALQEQGYSYIKP
ncbi:MAG: DsrE family protein [Lentilactobacillus hilgardii]|uniref:DsrE family protein n=1 Tax=Lentilactobacillus hilgardii TaxID=1588 RepID=UPI001CC20ADF|nr:DsrE family protein [Lentilactobacillus hilgardii]MBZ2200145.1 sulfur reduction protein DsrE [Lentilactobacillus hilgardii]MBZ2203186.1 sulfur reduction protein DsrE [Lentilactobacillus hilgardii]